MNDKPDNVPEKEAQRLFVAVPLPDDLKLAIGAWSRELRAAHPFRKWTETADLHVTLQFLGDTEPERIAELKSALTAAVGSIQPFRLSLQGTGIFGRPEQPRVFWAGIGGELESLRRLQRAIIEATAPLGFQAETRPYSQHLTIARNYTGSSLSSLPELPGDRNERGNESGSGNMSGSGNESLGANRERNDRQYTWQVDEVVLYRTHMHQRPMYEAAARFAFA